MVKVTLNVELAWQRKGGRYAAMVVDGQAGAIPGNWPNPKQNLLAFRRVTRLHNAKKYTRQSIEELLRLTRAIGSEEIAINWLRRDHTGALVPIAGDSRIPASGE